MVYTKLLTVKQACKLYDNSLDFAFSDQVEHLSDLLVDAEEKSDAFFSKNHVTSGMARLLRYCLQRLSGKSTQALFELRQAMGGGKTHSMLALGILARNPSMYNRLPAEITAGLEPVKSKVIAINGRTVSTDYYLWGDIANQLGKKEQFAKFWRNRTDAPSENDWINLIGDEPTLILLDELAPYFAYAITQSVGGGTLADLSSYALSNLLSAAMKLTKTAIVLSNLTDSYQNATKTISKVIKDISAETKRQSLLIIPVDLETNEIYEIIKKRMFSKLPAQSKIKKIAAAYGDSINEAVRSKTITKSPVQIAEEVMESYPFHPSVKNIISLFKDNENYRQTRGLMQFVSKMIKSVWNSNQDNIYLIGCQHLDLTMQDVRDEIKKISKLDGALSTDVYSSNKSAHAQTIDTSKHNNAATMVAKLLLTTSLSENVDSVKSMTKSTLIECLVSPDRNSSEFDEAFEDLKKECWYLHKKDNDTWYFSNTENLRKKIKNRASSAPQEKINKELKRYLENVFEAKLKRAYTQAIALPLINEIPLTTTGRICLVISPDSKIPLKEAQRFFERQVYKNGFCFVSSDGRNMGSLEDKVRRIWAIAKIQQELYDNPIHQQQLDEQTEQATFDFNASVQLLFNRVYFPMQKNGEAKLFHTKLNLAIEKKSNSHEINGEKAVEDALAGSSANKLVLDIKSNFNRLIDRAEDVLWTGVQTRKRWKDIIECSQSNPRWLWTPPKGLDNLRNQAVSIGRWCYDIHGYVDKHPPKAKTTLNITELNYNEATGESKIELFPQNTGKSPIIIMGEAANIDKYGKEIKKTIIITDKTKLWFKVVDSTGRYETGDVVTWNNRLHLSYELRYLANKKIVKLSVVPRGEIRWNITGGNPKEGTIYKKPIEIENNEEFTIYVYAENQGIDTTRKFNIRKINSPQSIDKDKPAKLKKTLNRNTIKSTFELLAAAKADDKTKLQEVSLTVGSGRRSIQARFGSETAVSAQSIENAIEWARTQLADNAAEVQISMKGIAFSTGFDLEKFVKTIGECIQPNEVDQK